MPKIYPNICPAAFIIKCTATGKIAKRSIVEQSDNEDNYRAEALGLMMLLLVLCAATARRRLTYCPVTAYCDNMGVVKHKEGQVQADVLNAIKHYVQELPCDVNYEHVYGHLDDIIRWDQLTLPQKFNVRMDNLASAKRALLAALLNQRFIDREIPFKNISL